MTIKKQTLIISKDELDILTPLAKSHEIINWLLRQRKNEGRKTVVIFEESQREEIRTALTVLLAKIGFDENYSPTNEGRLLEDLIDRLFSK